MPEDKYPRPDLGGEAFRPLPPSTRLLMTVGPFLGLGLILLATAIAADRMAVLFLSSMFVGGFIGGGKLVILAGAIETAPVGAWPLAAMVVYGDAATALVIMANMHHLYRIPALGRRLARAREIGFQVLSTHKWMRRAAELGLVVFVAMPFQGSGAVLGVVLGRTLGLSRRAIFACTVIGSAAGSALVALAGEVGHEEITGLAHNPALGLCGVVVLLTAGLLLGRWFLGYGRDHPASRDVDGKQGSTPGTP